MNDAPDKETETSTEADAYFLRWRGKVTGPHSVDQILLDFRKGKVSRLHQVSLDRRMWKALSTHPRFFDLLRDAPEPESTPEPTPPPPQPPPDTQGETPTSEPLPSIPSPPPPVTAPAPAASPDETDGEKEALQPARMGRRTGAAALDLVVLALLGVCGLLILRLVGKPLSDQSAVQKTVCWTIFFYLCWLYSAVLESCAWQTTLGKLALGLRVEADDLERIDFGRSSVRSLLKMISALPAFLGFWLAARDPARRAMHDRVARTRVVGILRPAAAAVPAITPDAAPQAQSAATARNMALAVVTSGDATSVTEQMVRELIDTDLERNPHLSASVAAIQGVMITEDASVSTEAYAQDMMTCYMGHMTHGGWTRPTGLHVFQAPLGQGRIHIAYGT